MKATHVTRGNRKAEERERSHIQLLQQFHCKDCRYFIMFLHYVAHATSITRRQHQMHPLCFGWFIRTDEWTIFFLSTLKLRCHKHGCSNSVSISQHSSTRLYLSSCVRGCFISSESFTRCNRSREGRQKNNVSCLLFCFFFACVHCSLEALICQWTEVFRDQVSFFMSGTRGVSVSCTHMQRERESRRRHS